jgi:ATP-dependent HslUV protease ATP-binding subunit HslU
MRRILVEPEANLIRQHEALLAAENVRLHFEETAIDCLADLAVKVNETVENIGARRLQTVLERLLDEISYTADQRSGETVTITADYVRAQLSDLAENTDLSKFIL